MASLIRIGFKTILSNNNNSLIFATSKNGTILRTITSKTMRDIDPDRVEKPKPWNYHEKSFTLLNFFFDKTSARMDSNSKIVVVEGPPAAGKTKFAKQLAQELDMLYFPEANLDMLYINSYGFDKRTLDPQLPESCRSFDVKDFLLNPSHGFTARFQIFQYQVKFSQYVDALAHLFSTGQGVVLDRCVYSDYVFAEAMFKNGYLSKLARKKYYENRDCTITELLQPHLVIYLDVPVEKTIENIRARNIPYESNSKVLTPKYLGEIEQQYKQIYLKQMNKHAELLVYDWSDEGDVEIVVEDIERIDFDSYDVQDPKMKDWVLRREEDWACYRHLFSDKKDDLMKLFNIPAFEVPEMVVDAEEVDLYYRIINNAPGERNIYGYNSEMGDQGLIFKVGSRNRETLPMIERKI